VSNSSGIKAIFLPHNKWRTNQRNRYYTNNTNNTSNTRNTSNTSTSSSCSSRTSISEEELCDSDNKYNNDDNEYSSVSSNNSIIDDLFATIPEFPVQLICMEKCEDTLDSLLYNEIINDNELTSALFQVIMTLIIYQKVFEFTHNDLHTNNIMYVETQAKYIFYTFNGVNYRVPTYGKIYKIIDFGRAIYKYNGRLFCSDSFFDGGDAATQYNTEPFLDSTKKRIDPNYSFDLCRLACSMYDYIIDDRQPIAEQSIVSQLIDEWCQDDDGRNMLYKSNGQERYPEFKLYKMIARQVHKHTPEAQLKKTIFKNFEIKNTNTNKKSKDTSISINIDLL
jgi:hypothetical protein